MEKSSQLPKDDWIGILESQQTLVKEPQSQNKMQNIFDLTPHALKFTVDTLDWQVQKTY